MKTYKIMFAVLFAFATLQSVHAQSDKSSRVNTHTDTLKLVQYACPMHPDVISDAPGKCSKCGMDLNLSKKEQLKLATVKYACPMHPEIVSDAPGKCSRCGMNLTLSKKEQMKMEAVNGYACPMHPDVTSDKAGACSKCGMKLVKKKG